MTGKELIVEAIKDYAVSHYKPSQSKNITREEVLERKRYERQMLDLNIYYGSDETKVKT